MKEYGEQKRKWGLLKKSNTCLWLTLAHMHAYANLGTNKQNKNSERGGSVCVCVCVCVSVCAHELMLNTHCDIGRVKGWKIRWIYKDTQIRLFATLLDISTLMGPDIASLPPHGSQEHTQTRTLWEWIAEDRGEGELFRREKKWIEYRWGEKQQTVAERRKCPVAAAPQVGCTDEEMHKSTSPHKELKKAGSKRRKRKELESKSKKIYIEKKHKRDLRVKIKANWRWGQAVRIWLFLFSICKCSLVLPFLSHLAMSCLLCVSE